ncbi:sigma-54 dependent transcriptional regulator [Massilia sp. METH4]|uniref:sigma-54 dependent transcriptional regulator n=1 Tax=Massilia sp. METH4 TaxID=3123041 RepID=UPI0030D4A95E
MLLSEPYPQPELPRDFVGSSPVFLEALALIRRFAPSRAPLLITGESGTGKELAALAAHALSERRGGPFIPVNCGALPDTLVESEFFGHAKGAFTDAIRARQGLVRDSEGGTLFLDEIEALSPRGQVSLLRFLQDASFRSLGEEQRRHGNARVVAASNVDLRELADRGVFRADLLFRLDVLSIRMPPLRERPDDLGPLAAHLLAKAAQREGGKPKRLAQAASDLLPSHPWPGNVRELEHVLLRAHLLSTGPRIEADDLRRCCAALGSAPDGGAPVDIGVLRREKQFAVREVERRFVERALAQANGNISEAARLCKMERATLSRLAKKYRAGAPLPA